MENPYLELTEAFNRGRLRVVLSSGQAVVVHRLAVMSKDGDWILREDDEATGFVLGVLGARGSRYRLGAPLDRRWLAHGWSSHLVHQSDGFRLRTDFVSRPPRMSPAQLEELWRDAEAAPFPVIGVAHLAEIKKTDREKDYAVIGELARLMDDPRLEALYSRSSRDLIRLGAESPELLRSETSRRPLLALVGEGREALERALDEERRQLMRANEERLARYRAAAEAWAARWPAVSREVEGLPLLEAHAIVTERAEGVLPFAP